MASDPPPPLQPAFSGSRTQDMMMDERNTAWMGTVARIIFRQKPCLGAGGGDVSASVSSSSVDVPRLVTLSEALETTTKNHIYVSAFSAKKITWISNVYFEMDA